MRVVSRAAVIGTIAMWLALLGSASNASAVTIGQSPPLNGTSSTCSGIAVQLSVANGPDYVVPAGGGVITSWSSSLSGTVVFSVFRGLGFDFSRVAIDSSHAVFGVPTKFDVRIPVNGGDRIGLESPASSTNCTSNTGNGGDSIGGFATAPVGQPATGFTPNPQFRFNLSAVVEPDADGDGYGDETQDGCPADPATSGPCPDRTAPETSIVKAPKVIKTKKRKAKISISFSSSEGGTFACSLDGATPAPCSSPFTAKVRKGKHSFSVVATDAAGNADATPAVAGFKVKRKR